MTDDSVQRPQTTGGEEVAVVLVTRLSLVAAGLLPQLTAGALPGSEDWVWVRFTPAEAGDNPFRALALRLGPHLPSSPSPADLMERLRREYREDVDIERLASELIVDAIVAPAKLRDEIAIRLCTAAGRRDPRPNKRRSITPV